MSLASVYVASGPLPSATYAGWDSQTKQKPLWVAEGGGGGGGGQNAAGPEGAVQFSDGAGVFEGTANLTCDGAGNLYANAVESETSVSMLGALSVGTTANVTGAVLAGSAITMTNLASLATLGPTICRSLSLPAPVGVGSSVTNPYQIPVLSPLYPGTGSLTAYRPIVPTPGTGPNYEVSAQYSADPTLGVPLLASGPQAIFIAPNQSFRFVWSSGAALPTTQCGSWAFFRKADWPNATTLVNATACSSFQFQGTITLPNSGQMTLSVSCVPYLNNPYGYTDAWIVMATYPQAPAQTGLANPQVSSAQGCGFYPKLIGTGQASVEDNFSGQVPVVALTAISLVA